MTTSRTFWSGYLLCLCWAIEKNRSYTSLSWDYYKRPIVIFWFRMYWCSSRQEREAGIEKNQKNFIHTLFIKQWHAPILCKPKFLLLIRKRECQAREKFLLFFSMVGRTSTLCSSHNVEVSLTKQIDRIFLWKKDEIKINFWTDIHELCNE